MILVKHTTIYDVNGEDDESSEIAEVEQNNLRDFLYYDIMKDLMRDYDDNDELEEKVLENLSEWTITDQVATFGWEEMKIVYFKIS